jgi:DNA-directed RNA polymerase specialized sigma24 family protein
LRILADLDVATVAARLQRPETWVRVTQHRALRRLAHRLGPRSLVTPSASDAM